MSDCETLSCVSVYFLETLENRINKNIYLTLNSGLLTYLQQVFAKRSCEFNKANPGIKSNRFNVYVNENFPVNNVYIVGKVAYFDLKFDSYLSEGGRNEFFEDEMKNRFESTLKSQRNLKFLYGISQYGMYAKSEPVSVTGDVTYVRQNDYCNKVLDHFVKKFNISLDTRIFELSVYKRKLVIKNLEDPNQEPQIFFTNALEVAKKIYY